MAKDIWTAAHVKSLAPDAASVPAAQKVLKKGGFGTVEPTADGRGWWVVCRGLTGTYQVSVRHEPGEDEDDTGAFACECNCRSYKNPCKHAIALLLYLVEHPELRTETEAPKVAASDFEALLRAVFANPEEDTARLVFADFLEENGEGDRAALVRLQCEQARLKPTTKRWKELAAELKPLVAKFKKQIEPLPEDMEYQLHRGFLRLDGDFGYLDDLGALPARFTALFRDGWVASVGVPFFLLYGLDAGAAELLPQVGELDVSKYPLDPDTLVTLVTETADARATGRLARVVVHRSSRAAFDELTRAEAGEAVALGKLGAERRHGFLNPRSFDLLLRTGQLDGARAMTLGGYDLGDDQLRSLLDTADLSRLHEWWLSEWDLTRTGVAALANSDKLDRLTELNLASVPLGTTAENMMSVLAAATGLGSVERLRLINCALDDADARTLAKSRSFPKLKVLELSQNFDLTAAGAAALLAAKHFPHLAHVDLIDAPIAGREQLPLLLGAPDRPDLRLRFDQLDLRRRVGSREVIVELGSLGSDYDGAFDDMASAKGAERVTQLRAPRAHLGAKQMADLAAGFDPETLWQLDLTDNPLRNDGAAALVAAFAGFHLRELVLAECRVQAVGVAALVTSALFARLHVLDLSRNAIGKAGCAALLGAEIPAKLKRLVLTDCRLTADDQKKLRAKFGPRVKL